jgi:protein tyrosine/serine phosphatase
MNRHLLSQRTRLSALAIILACFLTATVFAVTDPRQDPAQDKAPVAIENFGKVNDHIYRGGQPKSDDYRRLGAIGVKTILDLRGDNEPSAKSLTEEAGMQYINLPMAPKQYPQPDAAQRFLEIVNDQSNWPVYVHCAGGRHRTGAMIAAYRITIDGWDFDRTYQEMKDYGFYTQLGHGCYREYVNDYYHNWQERHQTYLPAEAANPSKMTRITKATRINTVAGIVERPLKRIYKSRPILNKAQ